MGQGFSCAALDPHAGLGSLALEAQSQRLFLGRKARFPGLRCCSEAVFPWSTLVLREPSYLAARWCSGLSSLGRVGAQRLSSLGHVGAQGCLTLRHVSAQRAVLLCLSMSVPQAMEWLIEHAEDPLSLTSAPRPSLTGRGGARPPLPPGPSEEEGRGELTEIFRKIRRKGSSVRAARVVLTG